MSEVYIKKAGQWGKNMAHMRVMPSVLVGGGRIAATQGASNEFYPEVTATPRSTGTQDVVFSRYLDTAGDGTGTKNANGNYSVTPETFYIQPPFGAVFRIARLLISIEDTSGMVADEYGNTGSALGNGIEVKVTNLAGTVVDLTDGVPITTNARWGSLCYDVDLKSWGITPSNDLLLVRWTFAHAGQFIRLNGSSNDVLEVILNDNLSDLIAHYFIVQGYQEGSAR